MFGYRVVVVPDDDSQAHADVPKDVLAALGTEDVLMGISMMYVRVSLWDRIKDQFPPRVR